MKKTLLNTSLACVACAFSAASFANTAVTTPAGGAATSTSATTTPAAPTYSTGQVQGQLAVELTIGKGCEVVNGTTTANNFGTLSFGEVSALTSAIDGQAKGTGGAVIKLNCTSGVDYNISLDNGRNVDGDKRRMAMTNEQGIVEYVPYVLYQDAARQKAWDSKTPYVGKGTGATEMTVYGRIPPMAQTPGSGKYSDIVTMTLSW